MYNYNLALRFQDVAEDYPHRTALWFNENETYSYRDLNILANRLARFLLQHGLTAGDVVCISGTKTVYTFAFMLACLKIGAIYSVFDPDSPVERLRKIFTTCRSKLLFAESRLLEALVDVLAELDIISLEHDSDKLHEV
jgi:D-alanine--poly(phosphoribitol) ligase subunit 1